MVVGIASQPSSPKPDPSIAVWLVFPGCDRADNIFARRFGAGRFCLLEDVKNGGAHTSPFFPLPVLIGYEPEADVERAAMSGNVAIDRGRYSRRMRAPRADASRNRSTSS